MGTKQTQLDEPSVCLIEAAQFHFFFLLPVSYLVTAKCLWLRLFLYCNVHFVKFWFNLLYCWKSNKPLDRMFTSSICEPAVNSLDIFHSLLFSVIKLGWS